MAEPKRALGAAEAGYGAALEQAPPRRLFAMTLMVVSSVVISFGGLVLRNIEHADPWQINVYRALAIFGVVSLILFFQHGRGTLAQVRKIGRPASSAASCSPWPASPSCRR